MKYIVVTLCCSMLAAAKDTKAEAKALLDRNRSLTQMRSAGDPSFKLRAAFTYQPPGRKSPPVEGTYELRWASPDQWKETFEAAGARVTRVFAQGALSRGVEGVFPAPDVEISDLFNPPVEVQSEYPSGIQKSSQGTAEVTCVNLNYVPSDCPNCEGVNTHVARIACFSSMTGLLQQLQVMGRTEDIWDYSDYRSFGSDRSVARILKRQTDEGDFFEAHVLSLDAATFSPSEFLPIAAPAPVVPCKTEPPRALHDPEPDYSQQAFGGKREIHTIFKVSLGPDGVPVSVMPVKSGGEVFDRETIRGLMRWRFAPATCKGHPVPTTISVEMQAHP